MKFTIAVHGSPYGSHSQHQALAYCQALCAKGHDISRVFFYHEGVYGALGSHVAPQDERDVQSAWHELASVQGFELCVCIANAIKRGVLDEGEAERYEQSAATIAPGFTIVGLGQLVDAIIEADRYVEFPA